MSTTETAPAEGRQVERRMGELLGHPEFDTAYDHLLKLVHWSLRKDGNDREIAEGYSPGWWGVRDTPGGDGEYSIEGPCGMDNGTVSKRTYRLIKALQAFCAAQRSVGISYYDDDGSERPEFLAEWAEAVRVESAEFDALPADAKAKLREEVEIKRAASLLADETPEELQRKEQARLHRAAWEMPGEDELAGLPF